MKIKELIKELSEIANKNPDAEVSIGLFDMEVGHGIGITKKFIIDWPDDVVLEVKLEDIFGKYSIQRDII